MKGVYQMAKLGKILGFAAIAGAILGGIYYFFFRDEEDGEEGALPKESEIKNFFDEMPSREYVSLNREASDKDSMKESIKEKIDQSVKEKEEKKREEEEGVGIVKEDVDTTEPEFEDFELDEGSEDKDE